MLRERSPRAAAIPGRARPICCVFLSLSAGDAVLPGPHPYRCFAPLELERNLVGAPARFSHRLQPLMLLRRPLLQQRIAGLHASRCLDCSDSGDKRPEGLKFRTRGVRRITMRPRQLRATLTKCRAARSPTQRTRAPSSRPGFRRCVSFDASRKIIRPANSGKYDSAAV